MASQTLTRELAHFRDLLPPQGRLLGLDPGSKTIGLALSDIDQKVASPLEVIKRTRFKHDIVKLLSTITLNSVCGLVIGYPLNMDGSEGPRCQSVRQFARDVEENLSPALPMLLWDERMSTQAVQRVLEEEGDLSRQRRAELVDKLAAGYILQGVLDSIRGTSA